MARRPYWREDVLDALEEVQSKRDWSLHGTNRLIKVVNPVQIMNPMPKEPVRVPTLKDMLKRESPPKSEGIGYVTQEKYLLGKTPDQIERDLGLRPFSLKRGCWVMKLSRLPELGEFHYDLGADMPGGGAFNFADREEAYLRYETDRSLEAVPYYPPGSHRIPQWVVTAQIPLFRVMYLYPVANYPGKPPA